MGMHEFEDLADGLIIALDNTKSKDLRSMYATISNFVATWDASLQHFHVLEQLLRHRFTYAFPIEDHPDYATNKIYFDNLHGYENICRNTTEEWDEENNPEVGIYCNPTEEWGDYETNIPKELINKGMLYFDAGGELWQRFVAAGKLTGKDAEAPTTIPLEEIIYTALKHEEDPQLLATCYALMPSYAITKDPNELIQNDTIRKIRDLVTSANAFHFESNYPEMEDPGMAAFINWWYAPQKSWLAERETDAEYWMERAHNIMKTFNGNEEENEVESEDENENNLQHLAAEAITYLDKSIKIAPDNWLPHYNRGLCYLQLQHTSEALTSFNTILSKDPNNDYAYLGIGLVELMNEHYTTAKEAIEKALKINPENEEAANYYAYIIEIMRNIH
jgi:hypothetical protein